MKNSLLSKAKLIKYSGKGKKIPTKDELELVMAWINGDIATIQACKAMYGNKAGRGNRNYSVNFQSRAVSVLKYFVEIKKIKIN